ncbi:MAG: amidohydrolase family protein [Oscillospiraceae bacterium]|nr:amidohydrolase family protein [Oscillospiraceae bacterium]
MVIKNVKICSMAGKDIENGFVRISGGIFSEVGSMTEYRDTEDEITDGCGLSLYPGFIDAHCHIGMWNDGLTFEGEDGNEDTDPSTPHLRALDSIDPMDRCFSDAISAGVTSVCTGVGSANPIGGSFVIMKTWGSKRIDKLIVKSPAAIKFALGENPKNTYNDRDESPVTRMATAAVIREQLMKAKRYLADKKEYERLKGTDDEISEPDYDIKCEALLPLFAEENKLKAHFHCHRADDIFTAVRLSKEFGLDYVLIHCTDGAVIADELAEDCPAVVTGPLFGDRGKPELRNHDIKTPCVLSENGIKCAICTDHPETPIQYLPLTAALAVRGGLSRDEALRGITIYAAETIGISDILGSIEVGKQADFSLFKGDPLDLTVTPEMVFIEGRKAFAK